MGSDPLAEHQESRARERNTPTLVRERVCFVCVSNSFTITASVTETRVPRFVTVIYIQVTELSLCFSEK